MKRHNIWLPIWWVPILIVVGCSAQTPTSTLSAFPLVSTPAVTPTLTIQEQQLAVIKALYSDYNGPQDICQWKRDGITCDEQGRIILLDASGLDLTSLPSEIGQLTTLKFLSLNDNKLSSLPPEIGQLVTLENLDLHDNNLTSLPPEIGQLVALRYLSLITNN